MSSVAVASDVFVTHSTEETIERGREIGKRLKPPVLILLSGELGTGKTTLTKGIVSGFGAAQEEEVTSPTFTLVHKYARLRDARFGRHFRRECGRHRRVAGQAQPEKRLARSANYFGARVRRRAPNFNRAGFRLSTLNA